MIWRGYLFKAALLLIASPILASCIMSEERLITDGEYVPNSVFRGTYVLGGPAWEKQVGHVYANFVGGEGTLFFAEQIVIKDGEPGDMAPAAMRLMRLDDSRFVAEWDPIGPEQPDRKSVV